MMCINFVALSLNKT